MRHTPNKASKENRKYTSEECEYLNPGDRLSKVSNIIQRRNSPLLSIRLEEYYSASKNQILYFKNQSSYCQIVQDKILLPIKEL